MMHTRARRWMRDPTDAHKAMLERLLPEGNYVWTGYSDPTVEREFVYELLIWAVDNRTLTLVDTLLGEYYTEIPR